MRRILSISAALVMLYPPLAVAELSPARKCELGQTGAVGKYAVCAQKAQQKFVAGGSVDETGRGAAIDRCREGLVEAWGEALSLQCKFFPDDFAFMAGHTQGCLSGLHEALAGGVLPPDPAACAGDLADCYASLGSCPQDLQACQQPYWQCETDLDHCNDNTELYQLLLADCIADSEGGVQLCEQRLATCQDELPICLPARDDCLAACNVQAALSATGILDSWGDGDDGDVQKGLTLSFSDNGDGTITDHNSGLMWEKKFGSGVFTGGCSSEAGTCGNPHNPSNRYRWSTTGSAFDGPLVTIFLQQLNNRCSSSPAVACTSDSDCSSVGGPCGFAGYRDWRIPNQRELATVMSFSTDPPRPAFPLMGCYNPDFCSDVTDPACSCGGLSWSSTTDITSAGFAWAGDDSYSKQSNRPARAVRGG